MKEMWQAPSFSLKERDRRWRAIREAMKNHGLNCLIIWGDSGFFDKHIATVRYVTQIGVSGDAAFVVFPVEGEPTCFIWGIGMVEPWRRSQNWVKDVRPPIENAGLSYWEVGIHGHGLTSREHPTLIRLAESAARGGAFQSVEAATAVVLRAGMVVGLVIDIINPNWKAGQVGINFGDTILVSEAGARRLTNYDTNLIVV